ncbi:hypothetical protein Tco_0401207 [Tanacetum coccineum]
MAPALGKGDDGKLSYLCGVHFLQKIVPATVRQRLSWTIFKHMFPKRCIVDFDADPRVPLILGRSFLKTGRALIDVYEGELTLRVGKEAVTFNLDQTSRYSSNYDDMTANRIDVIEMACEEYSQEVLGFSDVIASGNPTPYYDPIVSTSSPTLTPFGDSDFLLEEVDAFLALEDDPTSPEVDDSYYDPEGDILLLESFLNDDPSLPPPTQGNYLPEIRKELKVCEAKNDKSLIDEPPEIELKDLPPHLEYTFLEGDDKFPVIIAKYLSVDEKAALIKILKSLKAAIAWETLRTLRERESRGSDHLSRFKISYEIMIEPKEVNEKFPLETLNMVTSRGDSSQEAVDILTACHSGPTGGHYGANYTAKKDCPGFLKPLVLAVLSFDHSSFKSSASFEKFNILI